MSFYFCYSSALDTDSLNQWKMQHGYPDFQLPNGQLANAVDCHFVADFPSRFWGGRVLGLEKKVGSECPGILFEIQNEKDWHVIRHKEGVVTGSCVEMDLQVKINGKTVSAKAFTTHPSRRSTDGDLSPSFFKALQKAYEKWNLSSASFAHLK